MHSRISFVKTPRPERSWNSAKEISDTEWDDELREGQAGLRRVEPARV